MRKAVAQPALASASSSSPSVRVVISGSVACGIGSFPLGSAVGEWVWDAIGHSSSSLCT